MSVGRGHVSRDENTYDEPWNEEGKEGEEREYDELSTTCPLVNVLPSLSATDHQLRFPPSDAKGAFTLNEPGVDPDLRAYGPLSRPETEIAKRRRSRLTVTTSERAAAAIAGLKANIRTLWT